MSSKKAAKRLARASKRANTPTPFPSARALSPDDEDDDDDDDDDDDEEDDDGPMPVASTNCSMCIGVCTTRRCSECGVCVLCSEACEKRYSWRCQGRAACRIHKALAEHGVGPVQMGPERVAMCPSIDNASAGQALVHGAKWLLGYLALNPNAPLHEGSVVGIAMSGVGVSRYVIGGKRSLNMRFSADGTNITEVVKVMLLRLGQLATAQQIEVSHHATGGAALGSQTFLVGTVIKHPLALRHVLQLDVVNLGAVRLVDPALLACSRNPASVHNQPWWCQALHPIHHKQEKGLLAFEVRGQPEPELLTGLKTLLSNAQVVQALCMAQPTSAAPPGTAA